VSHKWTWMSPHSLTHPDPVALGAATVLTSPALKGRAIYPGKSIWNHEIHEVTEIWCNQGVHPTGEPYPLRKPFIFHIRVIRVIRG
jgi:hypothetical protein